MAVTPNQNIYHPTGLSPYNIVGDLTAMAESVDNLLTPQAQITRVGTIAEANIVAADRHAVRPISVDDPVMVWVSSEPTGRNLKVTTTFVGGVGSWATYFNTSDTSTAQISYTDNKFGDYGGNIVNRPTLTRIGQTVMFSGATTINTAGVLGGVTSVNFGTIPAGFRPVSQANVLQQASGTDHWLLQVGANGVVLAGRYTGTQGVNVWLPITATWITSEA